MNIYLPNGYLDIKALKSAGMPYIFITGARGTGKTYGELESLITGGKKFILMRRTRNEIDFIARNEATNPFAELNRVYKRNIGFEKSGQFYRIVERSLEPDEKGGYPVIGYIGILLALSTVANIRGFDGSQYEELFYDEFIPETHVRAIRDEHLAFLNAIETINRNRELTGNPPLQVVCASNSNRLDNALYMGLNLVGKVDAMKRKGQLYTILQDRGILLVNMEQSRISAAKRDTSLYRMAQGTGFESMALDNRYIGEQENNTRIKRQNIAEYKPLVVIGEICIYKHKSERKYYVSRHISGSPPKFDMTHADIAQYKRQYGNIWLDYLAGKVFCEDRLTELLLTKIHT